MRLEDKVAIVTGAANGIGLETAIEFARQGACSVLVDQDEGRLSEALHAVRDAGGDGTTVVADVTRQADVERYVGSTLDAYGRVDVLFNNAGIGGFVAPLHEYPVEEFDAVIAVNLRGVFLGLRFVLPVMVGQQSGAVVCTASIGAEVGLPNAGAYIAAKHGVVGLTKTAAAEVGQHGVRVNAVLPGVVDTRLTRRLAAELDPNDPGSASEMMAAWPPLGRLGEPSEIASVVSFLASDEARYVTGAAWLADGGLIATR